MNKREFERELWLACDGFFGGNDWKAKDGRDYTWIMDDLTVNCDAEQWLIVDETLSLLQDPDYITGDAPLDTPVSPNKWDIGFSTSLDTPVTGYQQPVKGWYYSVEDVVPQQMTVDQAMGYVGPFKTKDDAWLALVIDMDRRIDALVQELSQRSAINPFPYELPVADYSELSEQYSNDEG